MSLNAVESASHPGAGHGPDPYFRFTCVRDASDLETVYSIRYQVYCVEREFLDEAHYPTQLESDDYDAHALHVLATHRAGHPAGTARLVMSSPLGFPAMQHCVFSEEFGFLNDPSHPSLARYGEVSRLAVSKAFRRREGDTPYGGPPREESLSGEGADVLAFAPPRNSPEILMGICRLLYQQSKRRGITHWVFAMERSLYVLLKRMGFKYMPAGPETDYYGPVRPYVVSIDALERGVSRASPATFAYMVKGLEPALMPVGLQGQDASWRSVGSAA
ncbi:PEP-CTERM/exosortase system-associated acyltransferase [Thiocapsa roseopersicina]|uniref:N-acyl amino acid synthase, PEP-CTERM/exosortase system-associated n=1 Tax=Thiocapsa roseopersicina TaxID=1058 RepID=A0A1H2YL31_THIRO|nr:PEP-CTERM/exosortase system-associated acyltransferase [Thiocapsa roseopersicina]SDX05876.1 N-acyl amino acid synthase, PEP-CTERM/exosortase system-associated [Thiocapsa roseopersicina]